MKVICSYCRTHLFDRPPMHDQTETHVIGVPCGCAQKVRTELAAAKLIQSEKSMERRVARGC
jgi:hypothetical protein